MLDHVSIVPDRFCAVSILETNKQCVPLGPICAVSFYVSDSSGDGPLSKVVRLVSDSFCAVSFVMETHLSDTKVGPKPRIHNVFFVSIATMLTYNSILILILLLLLYLLRNF